MAGQEGRPYGLDRAGIDVRKLSRELRSLEENPIETMRDCAIGLWAVHAALDGTQIPRAFGGVYAQLSENIADAMDDGVFDHSEDINHTAGPFASYYYRNLRPYCDFIEGDDNALDRVASPWRMPLLDPRVRHPSTLPVMQFTLGMTTHINARDLAASLMESYPDDNYRDDFIVGIDNQIERTTRALAPKLIPGHPELRRAAIPAVLGMISFDRAGAWGHYHDLRAMPNDQAREQWYTKLDKRADRRNKAIWLAGRVAVPAAQLTEKLPS